MNAVATSGSPFALAAAPPGGGPRDPGHGPMCRCLMCEQEYGGN